MCRSFDCISKEPGDGEPTADFAALLSSLQGDCKYGEASVTRAASAPVLGRASVGPRASALSVL